MATTTLFALSNPGGKRVRLKSRKKATMARRRRRRRNSPAGIYRPAWMDAPAKPKKRRRRKSKGAKKRAKKARRVKSTKARGKRKSAKRVRAGKKAAATRKRKKAARRAAGKKGARKAKRKGSGRKAARRGKRKGSSRKRKASRRKGGKRRAWALRRRPRKGIYRPYARLRKGRRARFGNRTKARMAALGLASKRGGRYMLNPRRRRKARRNPVARRRRSRRRRNPMGIVRGVKGLFTKAKAMRYARLGLGAMLGMAAARQGPALLGSLPVVGGFLRADSPIKALALSAAAIGAAVMVGRKVRVPSDILTAATVGGAGIVAAGVLKLLSQRVPVLARIPGVSGMGDVVSPSQLVAGEAIFGGNGMGDYLQLSGPVPEQYFAGGLNGMGDYVEFQNRAAGVAAEAASAAQVDWSPGVETSF